MSRTLSVGLYGAAVLLVGGALTLSRINTNKDRFSLDDKSLLMSYTEKAMDKLPDNPITSALYHAKNKLSIDYTDVHYQTLRQVTFSILHGLGYSSSQVFNNLLENSNGKSVFVEDTFFLIHPDENVATTMVTDGSGWGNGPLYIIDLHFERDLQHFGSPKINRIEVIDSTKPGCFILDREVSDIETELPEILKELSD